jgi:hypothetical protein
MPLGQAHIVFITHQVAVIKLRRIKVESAIKQKLPRARLQQVRPTHDFGNFHRMVVHHNRKLIRGNVVSAPDHEIPEVPPRRVTLGPEMLIVEYNLLAAWNTKSPIHSRRLREILGIIPSPALPWINRLIVSLIRCACRLRQLVPRAITRINEAAIAQPPPRTQIELSPLALGVWRIRTAAIRTFIPLNPEPLQILEYCENVLRPAPLRIEILIPKNQGAARITRPFRRNQKSPRMAKVEQAGWRRRNPSAISGSHKRILASFQ